MRALLILALLGLATSASAEDRKFQLALGAYAVAGAVDVSGTTYLIGQGTAREAAFAPFRNQPVAFAATKLALIGTAASGLAQIHRTRPKLAFWLAVALASTEATIAARNARLAKDKPR